MRPDQIHVRWMIRRDMPDVLEIEGRSFARPWGERELVRQLQRRQVIGMVAEWYGRVIGYMVYELSPRTIRLLAIAVHPDFHGSGVGRTLLAKMAGKLGGKRLRVRLDVRETNLDAQRWLRACGWRATGVIRGHFDDPGEDAYAFEFRWPAATPLAAGREGYW